MSGKWLIGGVIAGLVIIGAVAAAVHSSTSSGGNNKIQVVAAENFWGSLLSQLGGNKIQVTSVVSDPNADPHEYESNTTTARQFAAARYIVLNGAGYDSWANKLLSANPKSDRSVLSVADLLGKKEGDNPHFWYSPAYVNQVIARMDQDLIKVDPGNQAYYRLQLKNLQTALAPYQNRIASIKQQFGGTKVAATEDIFAYLANAAGLDLISPPAFIQAVAEGNDPPTDSVVTFQQQLQSGQVKLLAYNQQTVTPLTDNIKKLAANNNIPVVGITETVQPPDTTFQDWMNAELISIENALNAQALGQ